MKDFEYNQDRTYKENFKVWRRLNLEERREFDMQLLTKEQSRQIFDEIYGRNKPLLARLISFLKS
tara:strand:+ start:435 stop:629 length:195 start_codon:yes stop_codon:yes gene_type:complete